MFIQEKLLARDAHGKVRQYQGNSLQEDEGGLIRWGNKASLCAERNTIKIHFSQSVEGKINKSTDKLHAHLHALASLCPRLQSHGLCISLIRQYKHHLKKQPVRYLTIKHSILFIYQCSISKLNEESITNYFAFILLFLIAETDVRVDQPPKLQGQAHLADTLTR